MSRAIRVLHLSTHNEECGIAFFQEGIVDAMGSERHIENIFFEVSPNVLQKQAGAELDKTLQKLFDQLKDFDILHIQHEYSFYRGDQLQRIVSGAKRCGKKVLFTLHTPPHARREHHDGAVVGLHPRSWLHAARVIRRRKRFMRESIAPLVLADLLVVPSRASLESFAAYGVPRDNMVVVELPVPAVQNPSLKSSEIRENLDKQPGDIFLSTVGFLSETKGVLPLIRSLKFLPPNYKLALIGGAHPSGLNDAFYDRACNLIVHLGLERRVYITGYVAEDERRDALVRETDICVFPYDRNYYDYVSSAALNNAIANGLPIVAYKTKTFQESNDIVPFINFCQSANYYEIARAVQHINIQESSMHTKQFAEQLTVVGQSKRFAGVYQQLVQ